MSQLLNDKLLDFKSIIVKSEPVDYHSDDNENGENAIINTTEIVLNNVWPASMSKPVYKDMCEVFMKKCDFFVTSVPNPSPICKIIRNINCLSMKALKDTPVKIVH